MDAGQGVPEYVDELKTTLHKEKIGLQAILITHWHPDHIYGIKDVLKLVQRRLFRRFVAASKIRFVLFSEDLPVYKRKLIEMPDKTKLETYGMPENPDTIVDFTFINNGTDQFEIETDGAHLK